MEVVVTKGMPFANYRSIDAVNASSLIAARRSMRHMAHAMYGEQTYPPSRSLVVGKALHLAILEPELFAGTVCRAPDVDRRTKAGKEEYAAFESSLQPGSLVLSQDEWDTVKQCSTYARAHGGLSELLAGGTPELTIQWKPMLHDYSIACKARIDFLCDDGTVIDIKTTRDASKGAFARACASYGYAHQAQWYMQAVQVAHSYTGTVPAPTRYVIAAVETDAPWVVALYELEHGSIKRAELDNTNHLLQWMKETREGEYSGPIRNDSIASLTVPLWGFTASDPVLDADDMYDDGSIPF